MLRPAKILLVGTSVATVAFATAASSQQVLQFSPGDVFAGRKLNVVDPAEGVSLTQGASGNAVEVEGENTGLHSLQISGSVRAKAQVEVHGWASSIDTTSAAVGNSAHAAAGGAYAGDSHQGVEVDGLVKARAQVTAELSSSGDTAAIAAAVGNDQSTQMTGGQADLRSGQYHYGRGTKARVDASLLDVRGSAALTASAGANQHALEGSAETARLHADQVSTGQTRGSVVATVDAAEAISALGAAAANSVTFASEGERLDARAVQSHEGYVRGEAYLKGGSLGQTAVMAAAVGNSVSADLYGPEITLDTDQVNSGGVEAEAAVFGGYADQADLSASAVGNTVHASACTDCDGVLTGTNNQVNNGDVSATARSELSAAGRVNRTANAVGNSAGYFVTRPK